LRVLDGAEQLPQQNAVAAKEITMPDRSVSEPYVEMNRPDPSAQANRAEDEPDLDGYDDTQRAEIALVEGDGPNDGVVMTNMQPDLGEDLDEDEIEDGADIPDDVVDTDNGTIR
jgi:hypothetical protein